MQKVNEFRKTKKWFCSLKRVEFVGVVCFDGWLVLVELSAIEIFEKGWSFEKNSLAERKMGDVAQERLYVY
jgi:hypothetical protein